MKQSAEKPKEDPDQMFFDFFTPEPGAAGSGVAQPTPVRKRESRRAGRARSTQADGVPLKLNDTAQDMKELEAVVSKAPPTGFITESRAAQIVLSIAVQRPNNTVKRVKVSFKPFRSTLYSFKISKAGVALVKFHVAFRRATETVILQAAQVMLFRSRALRRSLDRSSYDAFVRAIPPSDFELPGARKGRQQAVSEPGVHRSLEETFHRINAEYFESQLRQPQLCWSPVRARRILGSYQERNDRLIISRLFDSTKVPQFVLDYLMYHELLHKFLGIGRRNDGRRCMHGADFREIERKFRHYDEATKFLKKM
jgi:hypothetical protein